MTPSPLYLQKQRNSILFLSLLLCIFFSSTAGAQHLVGVRSGYTLSGIDFQRNDQPRNITTPIHFSLLYTYYHPMWDAFPYFGLQTGLNYSEQGFALSDDYELYYDEMRYRVVSIPLISQFHIDFWKLRLLVNVGAYGGYRLSAKQLFFNSNGEDSKANYVFDCYDTRFDYGFIGGGGLAFRMKPFEIQFECNYQYSLSMLYNPRKQSNNYYIYVYPHQLTFSIGLFFPIFK